MGNRQVTKAEFFATVGPMNVHPRSERDADYWETPSRVLIGVTTPGYMCVGETTYSLTDAAPMKPVTKAA